MAKSTRSHSQARYLRGDGEYEDITPSLGALEISRNLADVADAAGALANIGAAPLNMPVRAVSAGTTLAASDGILLVSAAGGDLAVALPSPVAVRGQLFYLKRTDATVNTVQVTPFASELIDGAASAWVPNSAEAVVLISDGTNWWTL